MKPFTAVLLRLTILIMATFDVVGQSKSGSAYRPMKFRHILEGLSQSNAKSILEDHHGFIWIGTDGGLNRYDGHEFRVYEVVRGDSMALPDNRINDLHLDGDQQLWVATYQALARYDYALDKFRVYAHPEEGRPLDALSLLTDHQGRLWVGTLHGLFTLSGESDQLERVELQGFGDMADVSINEMMADQEGRIWLGTSSGLVVLAADGQSAFRPTFTRNFQLDAPVNDLQLDHEGIYWIATDNSGLYRLNEQSSEIFEWRNYDSGDLGDNKVFSLLEDRENNLWVGTERGGLNLYEGISDHFVNYRNETGEEASLTSNSIWEIFQDSADRLWLGTNYQGISLYDPHQSKFNLIHQSGSGTLKLKMNTVSSFLEVNDEMWIGTDGGGISRWDRESDRFRFYNHDPANPETLGSNEVLCMLKDREGVIWVGNWQGGLNRFDDYRQTFATYKHQEGNANSIGSNSVFAIDEDDKGQLWMATWGQGISRFNKTTGSFYHIGYLRYDPHLLSSDLTYDVEVDDITGDIWVATILGLDRVVMEDNDTFTIKHYQPDEDAPGSISAERINCIYQDRDSRIWVGTSQGLNLFSRETGQFTKFYKADGLPGDHIKGIVQDDQGRIWVTTTKGVASLSENNDEVNFQSYTVTDGLQGEEFFSNAAYRNQQDEIFLGGVDGFNYFFPDQIRKNPIPPKVQLTGFRLFNEEVPVGTPGSLLTSTINTMERIELTQDQSVFSVEFRGVGFTHADKNQYAYQMVGFDKDWNYVGDRDMATYTNLDPGDYTFLVKSANHDQVWSDEKQLQITILPPWWKTWWAYLLFYGGFAGIVVGVFRVRLSVIKRQKEVLQKEVQLRTAEVIEQKQALEKQAVQLKELDEAKSRFFANISHEFRTPLTLILGAFQRLRNLSNEDEREESIDLGEKHGHLLNQLINQLLDVTKLEHGKLSLRVRLTPLVTCFRAYLQSFRSLADERGIRLHFESSQDSCQGYVDTGVTEKIFYNLLSNALKFTPPGGQVFMRMSCGSEAVEVEVEDTGIGMADDDLKEIFSRFYQVDNTLSRERSGTGIGLAIVKELVDLHQGSIEVMSEQGKGTIFKLVLVTDKSAFSPQEVAGETEEAPMSGSFIEQPAQSVFQNSTEEGGKPQVLLVEDHDDLRRMMTESLKGMYDVKTAADGQAGIDVALETIPDLVISDVMMPRKDGFELCEALKSDQRTSHIPVILLTARVSRKDKLAGLGIGADDYLGKPFDMEELKIRAQNLIGQREKLKEKFAAKTELVVFEPSDIPNPAERLFMESLTTSLEDHYSEEGLSPEDLAAELGLTVRQLNRKLKATLDTSVNKLIQNYRLQKACQLLQDPLLQVGEIGYQIGFNSRAYFNKCFREKFGVTPGDYQRQQKTGKPSVTS